MPTSRTWPRGWTEPGRGLRLRRQQGGPLRPGHDVRHRLDTARRAGRAGACLRSRRAARPPAGVGSHGIVSTLTAALRRSRPDDVRAELAGVVDELYGSARAEPALPLPRRAVRAGPARTGRPLLRAPARRSGLGPRGLRRAEGPRWPLPRGPRRRDRHPVHRRVGGLVPRGTGWTTAAPGPSMRPRPGPPCASSSSTPSWLRRAEDSHGHVGGPRLAHARACR